MSPKGTQRDNRPTERFCTGSFSHPKLFFIWLQLMIFFQALLLFAQRLLALNIFTADANVQLEKPQEVAASPDGQVCPIVTSFSEVIFFLHLS